MDKHLRENLEQLQREIEQAEFGDANDEQSLRELADDIRGLLTHPNAGAARVADEPGPHQSSKNPTDTTGTSAASPMLRRPRLMRQV